MSSFSIIFSPEILAATLRSMPPLLLAGLAGILTKRAGIENIGLEGLMLIGCFSGYTVNYLTESWILGILGGMIATTLIALLFGFFVIVLRSNEIIAGVAINSLGAGLSTYLLRMMFGVKGSFYDPRVQAIPRASFNALKGIPLLNTILNNQSIIVWISIALALLVNLLLFYTRLGTYVRAAGEDEEALATSGINVKKIRFITIIFHGILCGLGGAYLSTGYLTQFIENMSAGRGFIAMAAIAFSGAHPLRILGATGLFAFVESIAYRLQSINVPSYFALMTPYVVTVITLAITSYKGLKDKKGRRLV
ncbi:MAG: ABC transporter permease [Tissierellaceae bacterium]